MLKWFNKKMKKRKGFTLVELVVVIAILGILGGIAVPKLSNSRKNAAIAAHNANVKVLYSAATMFIAEKGTPAAGTITWEKGTKENSKDSADDGFGWGAYLQEWPKAPNGTGAKDADGESIDGKDYEVTIDSVGEITIEPAAIDIDTDTGETED